jgi:2-polyprenyl-3-methyl-5-hydroxy-6-metoxy-1,4-benzoquinol methylase
VIRQPFYENVAIVGSAVANHRSQIALAFARNLKVHRVLDIGCGDGQVSAELARVTAANVVCVDVSATAVQACTSRGLEAHVVDIGTVPLPFSDSSFDLVFMTEVVEHLVRPDRALEEVRRVLTKGGLLILSTPNLACLPNRALLALGIQPLFSEVSEEVVLGRRLRLLGQGGQPVGHLRLYTKRALLEFLNSQGFSVLKVRGAAFHSSGPLGYVERAIGSLPGLAMIFVVLAQESDLRAH